MQHLLRCWDRQSDGSEYKKTFRRPGLRTPLGELTALPQTPSWWRGAGCSLPKNPTPRSRPFGPRLSYPTPKLFPTPLRPSVCWLPVLCLYTNGHIVKLFLDNLVGTSFWFFFQFLTPLQNSKGNPLSWDVKYTGEFCKHRPLSRKRYEIGP